MIDDVRPEDEGDYTFVPDGYALSHVVAEMQIMRERMDLMMNALKGRVSNDLDDLVQHTDSPFTTPVILFPTPPKFRMS